MKITFIGGGNMATALIGGLAGKLCAAPDIIVVDPNAEALAKLQRDFGATVKPAVDAAAAHSDVIMLATKPQQLRAAADALLPHMDAASKPLLISIAAGIRARDLSHWFGGQNGSYTRIVRTMPNTPALIGAGITGLAALPGVSPEDKQLADTILRAVGQTVWLDHEDLLDPVTAISGSGPAYVFYFVEAMMDAAVELGLSTEQGKQLALTTFIGAAQLAAQSSEAPAVLRERVTSKGGTTYAALTSMAQDNVAAAIKRALHAASQRAGELGDEFGKV
ncbi:MAG: pyrroline-5-carboxylate reductase [Burkholderiaceae bacterium]|nr:MAG: pyrroline-5-carboxylate reductase [Burkholderiaceae bacterium]